MIVLYVQCKSHTYIYNLHKSNKFRGTLLRNHYTASCLSSVPSPQNVYTSPAKRPYRGTFMLCPRISVWSVQRINIEVCLCCKMYVRTCAKWKSNNSQVANHSHNKTSDSQVAERSPSDSSNQLRRKVASGMATLQIRRFFSVIPQTLREVFAKCCEVSAGASRMTAVCWARICGLR